MEHFGKLPCDMEEWAVEVIILEESESILTALHLHKLYPQSYQVKNDI